MPKDEELVPVDNTVQVADEEVSTKDAYEMFIEGLSLVGESLQLLNTNKDNFPIKLLISKLVSRLGLNNPELLEELTMIRFAVENKDYSLEKLTAQIMGTTAGESDAKAN
jgi:hypothetical protein